MTRHAGHNPVPRIEGITSCIHTGDLDHGCRLELSNAFRVYAVINTSQR
jgi:hypothetical protein